MNYTGKNQKEDIKMSNAYNIGQIMGLAKCVKTNIEVQDNFKWKDESLKYLDEIYKIADNLEL